MNTEVIDLLQRIQIILSFNQITKETKKKLRSDIAECIDRGIKDSEKAFSSGYKAACNDMREKLLTGSEVA